MRDTALKVIGCAPSGECPAALRTISLTDPEHVERYGLQRLAAEHGKPETAAGPRATSAA